MFIGTRQLRRGVTGAQLALALASLAACSPSAPSNNSAAPTDSIATAANGPDTASATEHSPSSPVPVAPSHWWNSAWDQRTLSLFSPGGYRTYQAAATTDNRWETLSHAPFSFYMTANSPNVGVEAEALWAWVALFMDCARGDTLVKDLTTEFGDQQRGAAAIASTRQEFLAWAATQPATLTLYMPATFGRWESSTGFFAVPDADGSFSTREGALASTTGIVQHFLGLATSTTGSTSGTLKLRYIQHNQPESAVCPSTDGGIFWADSRTQWSLQFSTPSSSDGSLLPVVRMTSEQAQAFASRDPSRRVIYELTVATTPQISVENALIKKSGRIVSARVTDTTGAVLAEQTY